MMKRSRHRLLAIALCAMALGVMGAGASSAQAVKPVWDINGAELTKSLLPEGTIAFPAVRPYFLTVLIGLHIETLCTLAIHFGGFSIGYPDFISIQFTVLGCSLYVNNLGHTEEFKNCKPENGEIETTELLGKLKVGENNIVFAPKSGTTIATIETSPKCVVGEEIPIEGVFAVKDSDGLAAGLEVNKTEHKFQENAAKTSLTALGESASIVGTAKAMLAGTHSGQNWRGLP